MWGTREGEKVGGLAQRGEIVFYTHAWHMAHTRMHTYTQTRSTGTYTHTHTHTVHLHTQHIRL